MRIGKEALAAVAMSASLAACSGSDDADTGTLSISLMDAPVDGVTELWVTISGIWVKPAGEGPAIQLDLETVPPDTSITVNLLELDFENASVLVDKAVVDARSYNWMELQIDDEGLNEAYVMTEDGGMHNVDVDVPSGRIRLVSGFDVGPNEAVRVYIDWKVRAALTNPTGLEGFLLRPAFRVLFAEDLGVLAGTITAASITANCTEPVNPVVYIYEGDIEPESLGDMAYPDEPDEPHMTVDGVLDVGTSNYDFSTVVTPGTYTLAYICDGEADTDDPEGLMFVGTQTITVDLLDDMATPEVSF
ncbi:MAG TPA: DUF4382 domain-containing protein [Gammaproteobacteria bacterium]|nr:DUF4382 domain-containing protein [Gammaproteobacteria bacterium]